MCSQISFPRTKLQYLFTEARLLTCPLVTLKALAARLKIGQSALTPFFGYSVDNAAGIRSCKHLPAIVAAFNDHGIMIELEWWEEPDPATFRARLASLRKPAVAPAPVHDIDPTPSTEDWIVSDPVHLSQGIAALFIHPPPPSNDPNTFQLRVSLSLARYPDEIEDLPVQIGLRSAAITPDFTGCQPAEWHLPETLKKNANTFTVLGPREGAVLDGTVMEQHTLATLEYTSGALPVVALQLRSRKVDLEVVPDDPHRSVENNRIKVLQRFLAECDVSAEDRQVTWSRARMVRRDDETDG